MARCAALYFGRTSPRLPSTRDREPVYPFGMHAGVGVHPKRIDGLAAGSLILREAGGIISGLDGSEDFFETGYVLCGTPKIYKDLAKLCAKDIKALLA